MTSKKPSEQPLAQKPSNSVAKFLEQADQHPIAMASDRLAHVLFGMDATASREPTWDHASHIQHEMFNAVAAHQSLAVQLCFYRGFRELKASRFCQSAEELSRFMSQVRCQGGHTQILRLLNHAAKIHRQKELRAIIFVGDAIEEKVDDLCAKAGELGLKNLPLFIFQEGQDPAVTRTFKTMAKLSGGAFAPFNLNSSSQLKRLLAGVAAYATGGRSALDALARQQSELKVLLQQLPPA